MMCPKPISCHVCSHLSVCNFYFAHELGERAYIQGMVVFFSSFWYGEDGIWTGCFEVLVLSFLSSVMITKGDTAGDNNNIFCCSYS